MIRVVAAKLASYPSFWKFLAFQIVAILCAVHVTSRLGNFQVNGDALPIAEWFTLPEAWRTVCAIARWLYFIPAFFVVQMICAELELRLVRAQVIAGLDRRDVAWAWVVQNIVLTCVALVATLAAALLFTAFPPAGASWEFGAMLRHFSGFALYGLVFLNITMLCAVTMRRPVPALALLIVWPLILEPMGSFLMDYYGYAKPAEYLPFASLGSLVSLPGSSTGFDPLSPMTLACLFYGLGAALLTWLRLRQIDL